MRPATLCSPTDRATSVSREATPATPRPTGRLGHFWLNRDPLVPPARQASPVRPAQQVPPATPVAAALRVQPVLLVQRAQPAPPDRRRCLSPSSRIVPQYPATPMWG